VKPAANGNLLECILGLASQALDLHTTLSWPKFFGSVPTLKH